MYEKDPIISQVFLWSLLMIVSCSITAEAQWSSDPTVNNAVCTASGMQSLPQSCSDGSGGAIVTWFDKRSGTNYTVYAQRISEAGYTQWAADGNAICTAPGEHQFTQISSDGNGGAVITWTSKRKSDYDIYTQRINGAGVTLWSPDGIPICIASERQVGGSFCSDGSGGAIITWRDMRSGTDTDIYAQRVNATGIVQWTLNGNAVCTEPGYQGHTQICSDDSGGAIIVWRDERSGSNKDIFAQRISGTGVVQWTKGGISICSATEDQEQPLICRDGSGGAIITWADNRLGAGYDIYAQRISRAGVVQWSANGNAVCTAPQSQYYSQICSDDSGGAIISWGDYRSGSKWHLYGQRIDRSGVVRWTFDGNAICNESLSQDTRSPSLNMHSDGNGGAIITWKDYRSRSHSDIYAQRINSAGDVLWTTDGTAICTASDSQESPHILSNGSGGGIISWSDYRATDADIYTSKINSSGGLVPVEVIPAEIPQTPELHPPYPNPTVDGFIVPLYAPFEMSVTIMLYTLTGQKVASVGSGNLLMPGYHELPVNTTWLRSGTYLMEMITGKVRKTRMVTVSR